MQGFQDFCKRYTSQLVFGGLSLLVLLPLLKSGYVLTLDMVFTPHIPLPDQISASYPFWLVLHLLNLLIPSVLIQKLLLLGILFVSGWSMYWVLQKLRPADTNRETWQWGSYFGGILYMFNPFVYDRFMAGQYMILAGYAMLPFFVYAFWRLYKEPSKRTALWLAGVTTLTLILSIHAAGPIVLLGVCMAVAMAIRQRNNKAQLAQTGKWLAVTVGVTLVANSFWIIPTMLGKSSTATIIGGFTSADQRAFATDPGSLGLIGNVLALNGFWGESKNLFITAADTYSWWLVPVIALWALVLAGMFFSWRRRKAIVIAGAVAILCAALLSVGTAGTFAAPLNRLLVDHVPFFAGYREPQKFVAVIAFIYAYFGAVAVSKLTQLFRADKKLQQHWQTVGAIFLLIPVLCAPLMPWGFHGQLRAADYPVEWYAIHDRIDATCTGNCKVLYLPWHLYMNYDFTGRVIANPAPKFFGNYIVSSTDPELDGAAAYSTNTQQKTITSTILPQAEQGKDVAALLKQQHIQYVLLAKENDFKRYAYLDKQKGLKVDLDTPSLKVYRVEDK
jgi:hypothetical protein